MIAPAVVRWVDNILESERTGVNALIPDVPRAPGEAPPPLAVVFNAMDHAAVARARLNQGARPELFSLAVRVAEEIEVDGNAGAGGVEDTCLVVVDLEAVATDADNAMLLADAYRIMRCVRRALNHAFTQLGMAGIVLEEQCITPPVTMTLQTLDPTPGSGAAHLALLLPFTMTDTWAAKPIPEL
jgi:hypothetical protein